MASHTGSRQLTLGETLRDKGLDLVEENAGDWIDWIRREAIQISARRGMVSASDLRKIADREGRQPHHPNAWGAVFRGRDWELVGFEKNSRPSAHARRVCLWHYKGIGYR
jgi:hypothetical protein